MKSLEIQIDRSNVEQQMAFDIVANTNTCLFITGKAGTGKTTFVKRIQEEINKNFIVLAPTGIAAINVGGETMHSFFGFPLEVLGTHSRIEVSLEKKMLLENVDTIIIDEASMIRSDMVDGMDRYLRAAFSTHMPFAGKQVVFVGDLYQLPPVVKKGSVDEEMLNDLYGTGIPFFYKAHVLKRMNLPKIEFRKIYRQNDADFVRVLNKIRIGETKKEDLDILNQRICKSKETEDFSVTLTAFNNMAIRINEDKLDEIEAEEFIYDLVDDLLQILDKDTLREIEQKIAKVGVSTAVKMSLAEVAKEQGLSTEELETKLNEAGLDDEFIEEQTTKLINELYKEDATVESVTDTIVDVVVDSFDKIKDSGVLGDEVEELSDDDIESLREELASVLSELADENGKLDGDGLLSSLIASLMSEGEGPSEESESNPEAELSPSKLFVSNAVHKLTTPMAEAENTNTTETKPLDEIIRDTIHEAITDDLLATVRVVAIGLFAFVAFFAFWWLYLLIKLLLKFWRKNPLIKLKTAIFLGGFAFVVLAILPNTLISILSNPPSSLGNVSDAETLNLVSKLFSSAIQIKFSSSTIFAFICAIVLLVFSFPYASRRRAIRREIKAAKREARRLKKEQR